MATLLFSVISLLVSNPVNGHHLELSNNTLQLQQKLTPTFSTNHLALYVYLLKKKKKNSAVHLYRCGGRHVKSHENDLNAHTCACRQPHTLDLLLPMHVHTHTPSLFSVATCCEASWSLVPSSLVCFSCCQGWSVPCYSLSRPPHQHHVPPLLLPVQAPAKQLNTWRTFNEINLQGINLCVYFSCWRGVSRDDAWRWLYEDSFERHTVWLSHWDLAVRPRVGSLLARDSLCRLLWAGIFGIPAKLVWVNGLLAVFIGLLSPVNVGSKATPYLLKTLLRHLAKLHWRSFSTWIVLLQNSRRFLINRISDPIGRTSWRHHREIILQKLARVYGAAGSKRTPYYSESFFFFLEDKYISDQMCISLS